MVTHQQQLPGQGRRKLAELLNVPIGGAGLNSWLVSCASGSASSGTSNQWSNLGDYACQGLFGNSVGNILVAPNGDSPNCAIYSYGGENDGSYGRIPA